MTLKDNSSHMSIVQPSSLHNSVSLGFDNEITMQRVARLRSYESESLLFYTVSVSAVSAVLHSFQFPQHCTNCFRPKSKLCFLQKEFSVRERNPGESILFDHFDLFIKD